MAETFSQRVDTLKKKYSAGSSDAPQTMTGAETQDNTSRSGMIPGRTNDKGMWIPNLGQVYREENERNPLPEYRRSIGSRRKAVGKALRDALGTEAMLRKFEMDVPDFERPMEEEAIPSYIRYPLAILNQLQRGQFAVVGAVEGLTEGDLGSAANNFYRGLIYAEPHETADILERFEWFNEHPKTKFAAGLAGDILADPLTYLSFGTYGAAKASATKGLRALSKEAIKSKVTSLPFGGMDFFEQIAKSKKVAGSQKDWIMSNFEKAMKPSEIRPFLNKFGNEVLDEAIAKGGDAIGTHAVMVQIAKKTHLGRRIVPNRGAFATWVPRLGGRQITDVFREGMEKVGKKFDVIPGGVIQRIDDLEATTALMDKITSALTGEHIVGDAVNWFGEAFKPYWGLRGKYEWITEMDRAINAGQHHMMQGIIEKAQEIIKILPDGEERKLLTTLVQNPEKVLGYKFVKKMVKGKKSLAIHFNTDYFQEGQRISNNDAESITDFFYGIMGDIRREQLHPTAGVVEDGLSRAARELDVDNVLSIDQGAYGMVHGGDKWEQLRPYLQSAAHAHPRVAFFELNFGDFVVKVPNVAPNGFGPANLFLKHESEVNPRFLERVWASAASEGEVMGRMGGNTSVASGRVVWTPLKNLVSPGAPIRGSSKLGQHEIRRLTTQLQQARAAGAPDAVTGLIARRIAAMQDKFAGGAAFRFTNEGVDRARATHGYFTGRWEAYKKAVPDPKQRDWSNLGEFAKAHWDDPVYLEDIQIPVIVKSFVKGKTMTDQIGAMVLKHANAGVANETIDAFADVLKNITSSIDDVARTGISVRDMHGGNIMIDDTTGKAVLVDYSMYDDYSRGASTGSGGDLSSEVPRSLAARSELPRTGRPYDTIDSLVDPVTGVVTRSKKDIEDALGRTYRGATVPSGEIGRTDKVHLLSGQRQVDQHLDRAYPGAPGFERAHPGARYRVNAQGEPFNEFGKRWRNHQVDAYRRALNNMWNQQVNIGMPIQRTVDEFLRVIKNNPSLSTGQKHDAIKKFLMKLKADGVAKNYSMDMPLPHPLGGRRSTFTTKISPNHPETKVTIDWAADARSAFKPISETKERLTDTVWEQSVKVAADKHPDLLALPAARQDAILKAYGLAKQWKTELEQSLFHDSIVDPIRMSRFKNKWGLEHIPEYDKIQTPRALFSALNKSVKGRGKSRSLMPDKLPKMMDDLKETFGYDLRETDIAAWMTKYAIDVMAATDSVDLVHEIARYWGKPLHMITSKGLVKKKVTETVSKETAVTFRGLRKGEVKGRVRKENVRETKEAWVEDDVLRPDVEDGYMHVDHPMLEGLQIPEELGQFISRYSKTFVGDKVSNSFWRNYDKVLANWKAYATVVKPGFHGRNFASNMFQLYLQHGPEAFTPGVHMAAAKIASGKFKTPEDLLDVLGKSEMFAGVPLHELADKMRRLGIFGTGWSSGDLVRETTDDIGKALAPKIPKWKRIAGIEDGILDPSRIVKAGRKVGEAIENEGRIVSFLLNMKRTGNDFWSASQTKMFMFDYTELTNQERWMKRFIPFYTWMRKNIELQATQIIKQPGKYGNVERIKKNMERASPETDERWLPTYFPELYAFKTPLKSNKGNTMYINPNLPFQDLNRIFSGSDWLSSLAPFKAVAELALNKQFFNQQPIAKNTTKLMGELVQVEWLDALEERTPWLAPKVAGLFGGKKMFVPETNSWQWSMPARTRFILEQANPLFRNAREFSGFATGNVPYYKEERRGWDILSATTGVKFIPFNPTEQFEKSVFERRDQMRDLAKYYEQLGMIPSKKYNIRNLPKR